MRARSRKPATLARGLRLASLLLLVAGPAAGQGAPGRPGSSAGPAGEPPMVETAPIRCWWRTSKGAVILGEHFDVRLTCAVLETDSVQVVPDETRLTVAGVAMKPFEVLGGDHPADTRAGQRRFFQYRYTVRLLDRDAIGRDVQLPNLAITYKVQSRVAANATLAGRDFTYVMPGIPVRLLSQVPLDALDVRDGADVGLERIEALQFRARLFEIGALALAAAGALLGVLALLAVVRRARPAGARERARMPDRRVLAAADAELSRVAREAAGGWTPELVSAGHAALRVVGALALGRTVSEPPLAADRSPIDGRIAVRARIPRRAGAAVTSRTTATDLAQGLAGLPAEAPSRQRAGLEALHGALTAFTVAQYASDQAVPDPVALSGALATGREEAARLMRERRWRRSRSSAPSPGWQEGAARR